MLTAAQFSRIILTLREADKYWFAEARCRRAFLKPSHHAKRHAIRLGLTLDTRKAAAEPETKVYGRVKPQVVQTYSPVIESHIYMTATVWTGPTTDDLVQVNHALCAHLQEASGSMLIESFESPEYSSSGSVRSYYARQSRPDVPLDVSYQSSASSGSRHSSGSSASDSSAVVTPESAHEPLKIRIKRKSRDANHEAYVEKRPKYTRPSWAL